MNTISIPREPNPALEAPAAPGVPDGWKLMPTKATSDMLYAMAECDGYKRGDRDHPGLTRWEDYWHMALAAAPQAPVAHTPWLPYLSDRADGVRGHYAIARHNPAGYREVWSLRTHRWASASDGVLTLDEALALLQKLTIPTAAPAAPAVDAPPEFPAMNDELAWILGLMCFQCTHIAQALRIAGYSIKTRAEDEQAAALHWMLRHYFRAGPEGWRAAAAADMERMRDTAAQAKEGGAA